MTNSEAGKRIGIIIGGNPEEIDYALKSAQDIKESLSRLGHQPITLYFDQDIIESLRRNGINVAFILDATFICPISDPSSVKSLRAILEGENIPYTGSKLDASEIAKNKLASKLVFLQYDLTTPKWVVINPTGIPNEEASKILQKLNFPIVMKPRDEGSSVGIKLSSNNQQLVETITGMRERFTHFFAEEYISGIEVTVPVIDMGNETKALTVIEIAHPEPIYSAGVKLRDLELAIEGNPSSIYHVPARLPREIYLYVQECALRVHKAVGCRGFSRVDIIVDNHDVPQVLEINALPTLARKDFMAWSAKVEGIDYDSLVNEILQSTYTK